MTRIFATDIELFCSLGFTVALFAEIVLSSLTRLELIRSDRAVSGYESGHRYNAWQLQRMHKLAFPRSGKRCLLYIFIGITLLTSIPCAVLSANNLMDNRLLHLTSRMK
jgi:hypothetical protein